MKRLRILNGNFDVISTEEVSRWAEAWFASERRGWIATVNVAILMMMRSDPRLQSFVDRAALTVADGVPLVWVSKLGKLMLPERVAGVELVEELCGVCQKLGISVYFLGAKREVVEKVTKVLLERYPRLQIAGFADGYFSRAEAVLRADAIQNSGARLLIVGMGVPRQERFLEELWDALGVQLAIGVGGSFEVLAGYKKRAPLLMQQIGLEWLYRLAQEPRRLFKRYLVTNSQFLLLMSRDLINKRSPAPSSEPSTYDSG